MVCVHVCILSLMQNGRGIPNHPLFHPVLFLLDISVIPLTPFFFGHLASVNRPLTEALRHLSLNGLCGVIETYYIPPNLNAKSLPAAMPMIRSYVISHFLLNLM